MSIMDHSSIRHLIGLNSLEDILTERNFIDVIKQLEKFVMESFCFEKSQEALYDSIRSFELEHQFPACLSIMSLDQLLDELTQAQETYLDATEQCDLSGVEFS